MKQAHSRYADWKAPAEDGETLVWPEPAQLLEDASRNGKRLARADATLVSGVPLAELRRRARAFIGVDDSTPLIATGHQTELYHPGVWVKDALIDAAAAKLGGKAFHFAVDTDAPKHLHVRWPGGSRAITDDENLNSAEWAGLLSAPTPRYVRDVEAELAEQATGWSAPPAIDGFLASLRRLALETPALSPAITNATHELDWSLGLRQHSLLTSPLWWSEPYLLFAHHLLGDPKKFAANYNGALESYRRRNGIKTVARPMPDLRTEGGRVEAPFWVDYLADGSRERAFVEVESEPCLRLAGGETFEFGRGDPDVLARSLLNWCRQHEIRLSPRALTLTMFLRLFIADQFVHGIGGGRYDQVTDELVFRHFTIGPPSFAVTTATMYFPAAVGQRRVNLRPLLQEGRRIRHGLLSRDKMAVVAAIDRLPRASRERRDLFFSMHRKLSSESNNAAVREWEERLRAAEHESFRQKTLFDRELFFAIQPRDRLSAMIEHYRSLFAVL